MWLPLLLSVLTFGSISCEVFTAIISTLDRYEVGKDITCKIVITNNDDKDYYLLRRNTPLDKLASHTFQITQNGNLVPYDGFLYQRTPPTTEDFILVVAKSSVSLSVDLSQYYSLKTNASYKVMLKTIITYYEHNISNTKSQYVSSRQQSFGIFGDKRVKLTEAEAIRINASSKFFSPRVSNNCIIPTIEGNPKRGDRSTILDVFNEVCQNLDLSIENVDSNIYLYSLFFGVRNDAYINAVQSAYYGMKETLETYKFNFYFDGPICAINSGIVAYTCKRCTTIFLCDKYRELRDIKGCNTKVGCIIHELSHAAAFTDDIAYGYKRCKALAKYYPKKAISNADNYHYFSEPLSQVSDHFETVNYLLGC